ncbi:MULTISPECIES: M81 family metallopeptidase [unclassified Roseitalea]|uniref:M81 family metallopeptidase n=1 Tax=unclassified Roseitalea TaxID=2639107 RepID=UPI00273EDC13|nr:MULTISPECIES: M81 family metallopeptidase [unclassified Roseitalea]
MSRTVLVAGLYHETHSFLAEPTTMADFDRDIVRHGQEVVDKGLGSGSPMDGFLSAASELGWSVIPSVHMSASPAGTVDDAVVDAFEDRFFADVERHLPAIDAIFLVLHGAMVSRSRHDVEGEMLTRLRRRLGPRSDAVPVVGVLDLHANVSRAMVDNSTLLVAYRENPHSDARQTAVRATHLLAHLLERPGTTQLHWPTPYVLPPVGVGSAGEPMKSVLARARAIEAEDPDMVCINVMAGYAYADIGDCGFSLNCTTRGPVERAVEHMQSLQAILESNLEAAYPRDHTLEEALALADALPDGQGPVLLIEPADNIGGGAPGDATGLLEPLLATGRCGIVAAIKDPEAVAACRKAGTGGILTVPIGGKTDGHHGRPIAFAGRVRHLSDGVFELENPNSHMASMGGTLIRMGDCAVIENDQATILLTSKKTAPMDLGHLHSQCIRPEDAAYVIVKAAVSHKDAYDPIARASFYVDSPGLCTSNLARLPYRNLRDKRIAPG